MRLDSSPSVVKVYGIYTPVHSGLVVTALVGLQGQDLSMWLLGLAGAWFSDTHSRTDPVSLRNRHRLSLMAALQIPPIC